jgi:hypothetical protein
VNRQEQVGTGTIRYQWFFEGTSHFLRE